MRRKWGLVFTLAVLGGAALHFLYDVWPNPLTAVLAPVNESVWEHLKLLYWPFLMAGFVLCFRAADAPRAWSGFLLAQLVMPAAMLGTYYTLRACFGVHALWLDVTLYYLVLALGFWLAYRLHRSGRLAFLAGVLVSLVGLYGAALVLFTMAPPELPIFAS